MKRYFVLALLFLFILFLSACSRDILLNDVVVAKPSLEMATMDNPLVIQEIITLPVGTSTTFDIRFFNTAKDTVIGFGSDLREKATITCFGLEGVPVSMVLRASPVAFASSEEKELTIQIEDKSRSTRGKEYTCTLQLYNDLGKLFQKDFTVILE